MTEKKSSGEALQMAISQESLFFPLPFTNATIDNVVQVRNPLHVVEGNPRANVISFKILSEVQHRYSVRPPVGFIAPDDHATIIFSFNPEQVRTAPNPADRELPTEATRDSIHIDFAIVDPAVASTILAHWSPHNKDAKVARDIVASASSFWKNRGQVTHITPTTARCRLRCVFSNRSNVPESLVMRLKEEGEEATKAAAAAAAAAPKSRPPATGSTHHRSMAPPEAPPHRYSDPNHNTAGAATASGSSTPQANAVPPTTVAPVRRTTPPPPPASNAASTGAPKATPPPPLPSSSSVKKLNDVPPPMVTAVLNHKLSFKVVAMLLVLTLFCGLWDQRNLLTWLIAG